VQIEQPGRQIAADGGQERQPRLTPREGEDDRREGHQHHIQWQDVEITELMSEQRDADRALHRLVKDDGPAMVLDERGKAAERVANAENQDRGESQRDMRSVDSPRPRKAAARHRRQPRRERLAVIGDADGNARKKNESLGAVGQGEIARRHRLQKIARNVVDHDGDEDEAPREIDGANAVLLRHCHPRTTALRPATGQMGIQRLMTSAVTTL